MTSPERRAEESRLAADGWMRRFVADEPRLSEALALYAELGLEVLLTPVPRDDASCTECMTAAPDRFRVIYTRPPPEDDVTPRPESRRL